MKKEHFVGAIFTLTALSVLGIMFVSRKSLSISDAAGKTAGAILFSLGIAIFLWVSLYLRKALQGIITPVNDRLIITGPYCWIRHPLYLSMIIILLGIGIFVKSLWGIISIFLLFFPTLCFRATLEERALSIRFDNAWAKYCRQTRFLIPFLW